MDTRGTAHHPRRRPRPNRPRHRRAHRRDASKDRCATTSRYWPSASSRQMKPLRADGSTTSDCRYRNVRMLTRVSTQPCQPLRHPRPSAGGITGHWVKPSRPGSPKPWRIHCGHRSSSGSENAKPSPGELADELGEPWRRQLPRSHAARVSLHRARAHGAATRRTSALLPGDRATAARSRSMAQPARQDCAASSPGPRSARSSKISPCRRRRDPRRGGRPIDGRRLELDERGWQKLNRSSPARTTGAGHRVRQLRPRSDER